MLSDLQPKKMLVKASTVSVATRILTTLISISILGMLAKVLSADDLAIYWIFLSILSLVSLIAQFGLGQVVISNVSQAISLGNTEDARATAVNATVLILIMGAVSALVIFLLLPLGFFGAAFNRIPLEIISLMATGAVICSLAMLIIDLLKARMRLTLSSFLSAQPASGGILPSAFFLAVLLIFFHAGYSDKLSLTIVCFFYILGWLILLIVGERQLGLFSEFIKERRVINWRAVNLLMLSSAPIAAAALAMYVLTQADLWIVFSYLDPEASATYGIAANFAKYVSAVNILIGALLPGLVGHMWANKDLKALQYLLRRLARIGAAAALAILLVIFLGARDVLLIIVGSEYLDAATPLFILSFGHFINALMGYPQVLIITAGVRSQILYASLTAGVVTVCGLFFAVPLWGIVGAASLTSVGFILYGVIISIVCVRQTGIHCHVFARV